MTVTDDLLRPAVLVDGHPVPLAASLTPRELQVLTLMAEGLTAVAIGHRLGISPGTVRKHVEHLYEKLSCHDRLLAVLQARTLGLLAV